MDVSKLNLQQIADLALAEALVQLCREHGLSSVRVGEVEVRCFAPVVPVPVAVPVSAPVLVEPEPPVSTEPDSDTCPCGHSLMVEHGESGCYHGCKGHRCFPRAEAP